MEDLRQLIKEKLYHPPQLYKQKQTHMRTHPQLLLQYFGIAVYTF